MTCLEWKWSSKHICTKCWNKIAFIWLFLGPRRSWDCCYYSWMNLASTVNEKSCKWSKSHDVKKYEFCHFKENQMKNWKYHICALPSKSSNFNKKLWKWPKSHDVKNVWVLTFQRKSKEKLEISYLCTFLKIIKFKLKIMKMA